MGRIIHDQTVIQLHIILEIEKRPVSVVLVVPPEVGSSVVSTLDAAKIVETLQLLPSVSETQRVIGTLLPDGQLTLSHAIQGGETVLPLKAKMESDEQKGTTPSS